MAFLTDQILATGVTLDDLIHIVITGDTSQNPAGSSYKATIGQVLSNVVFPNDYWTSGSTGTDSIKAVNSSGLDATGNRAVAWGEGTLASGQNSTAYGYNTIATGTSAHAEGALTMALNDQAHAEGNSTVAYGADSHAEGDGTIAYGGASHAEGVGTIAYGGNSHAEGLNTISMGGASHSEGLDTISMGAYSHSEGTLTIASGNSSHAEGFQTTAYGDFSHSEGENTIASGTSSHSEGFQTSALGDYSHSEGTLSIASGTGSHAEGNQTTALGAQSHAEGVSTMSIGYGSHTEGNGTVTSGDFQHAQGIWNVTGDTTIGAFILGNGTNASNRSNLIFAGNDTVNISGKTITTNFQMTSGATSGYVLTSTDNDGNAVWKLGYTFTGGTVPGETIFSSGLSATTISATTIGSSTDCVDDLYVYNIHSCSPLNINPLDEGNIYFGSTSGITIDPLNNYVGIGTYSASTPNANLDIRGDIGSRVITSTIGTGAVSNTSRFNIYNNNISGKNQLLFTKYGGTIDSPTDVTTDGAITLINTYMYKDGGVQQVSGIVMGSINTSSLNYNGYISFTTTSGTTTESRMYINYDGNVGIGTDAPSEKLDVSGKTKTINFQMTSGATPGYVLTSDASGNASWQASTGGGVSIDAYYTEPSNSVVTWNVSGNSTNYQTVLTANTTLNLSNVRNGDYGTIIVQQDAVGSRTITFGTINGAAATHRVANGGGGSPVLTSNTSAIDILTFTYNGSVMYWTVGNDYT